MKYKCLVWDHDDTTVNSTATIHHPAFLEFLKVYYPDRTCSLEEYFLKNFSPGFIEMCREEYGMTDEQLDLEVQFWLDYVKNHIPVAYPGIREIMVRQKAEGGKVCVISHSMKYNILRDFKANGLPEPDLVYGWEEPPEHRKPNAWPMEQLLEKFSLQPSEVLMIDDLKPGYDMAREVGVDFAAVGWSNDIPEIESFMRSNCRYYFKTVEELAAFVQ
ncbi:MAG: HAD hydrolase-like protein [Oscillospiraceae bacterium]|nr:HAD hydrolase-like protein [Oscillospiraceae bacterium]